VWQSEPGRARGGARPRPETKGEGEPWPAPKLEWSQSWWLGPRLSQRSARALADVASAAELVLWWPVTDLETAGVAQTA